MKSKKLIQNAAAMLAVVMMTTVMVLSGCGNAAEGTGDHASVTIRLSGSGSGRAVSDAEKAAATFNVYFNDKLVASNISGTYNGTAVVGTTLNIRVDALVNGKRIARGENTITVMSPSNNVDVKLEENREQGDMQQPAIPYRELSTAQVGDVICANGKVLSASDITTELQSQTVAVVYKIDTNSRKVWAVGKILSNGMMWAHHDSAIGFNKNITGLQESSYSDGSTGLSILRADVSDADDASLATNYPAWDYACNYGKNQGLDSFQTGWYLPSRQELTEVHNNKTVIESALAQTGVSKASFVSLGSDVYWSSTQSASPDSVSILNFDSGSWFEDAKNEAWCVCAVRQFTF